MYQISLSANIQDKYLKQQLRHNLIDFKMCEQSVSADKIINNIMYVSIGAAKEDMRQIQDNVVTKIIDLYLTIYKRNYIETHLKLIDSNEFAKQLLLNTLVAFDRESEEKILYKDIAITNSFSIDGYYNFRMQELKERWGDLCKLTSENSMYLSNEDTLYELVRFLLSAVRAKVSTIEVMQNDNGEYITIATGLADRDLHCVFNTANDLMLFLVDNAPEKIVVRGAFGNQILLDQIASIFDGTEKFS